MVKAHWYHAIKNALLANNKSKTVDDTRKKGKDEKKRKRRGLSILCGAESESFKLFGRGSSIEEILNDADQQNQLQFKSPVSLQPQKTPISVQQRTASSSPLSQCKTLSPKSSSKQTSFHSLTQAASPPMDSPKRPTSTTDSPELSLPQAASQEHPSPRTTSHGARSSAPASIPSSPHLSHHLPPISTHHEEQLNKESLSKLDSSSGATKIQAAYRSYKVRKNYVIAKSVIKLQKHIGGPTAIEQVTSARRHMQFLVRSQFQIHARRAKASTNKAEEMAHSNLDIEMDNALNKSSQNSENQNQDGWDDSLLNKEEREARQQKRAEAAIRRERAMAYAHCHRLTKSNSSSVADSRSIVSSWSWSLNHHLNHHPLSSYSGHTRSPSDEHLEPLSPHANQPISGNEHYIEGLESMTISVTKSPRSVSGVSTRSTRPRQPRTPRSGPSPRDSPVRGDNTRASCPSFSTPRYMTPTASAKAKARPGGNTSGSDCSHELLPSGQRRLSCPLMPSAGSSKWERGSSCSSKDINSPRASDCVESKPPCDDFI